MEHFPDPLSDIGEHKETSDDVNVHNEVEIVLGYTDDNEVDDVPQVASAAVPDQDNPEKYSNTDKDTLARVIRWPFYYGHTYVFRDRGLKPTFDLFNNNMKI